MASPGDSMLEMKKRKRMQVIQKAAAEQKKKEDALKKQTEGVINLGACDLGASPQMRPVQTKVGGKFSPLSFARELQLPSKQSKQQTK